MGEIDKVTGAPYKPPLGRTERLVEDKVEFVRCPRCQWSILLEKRATLQCLRCGYEWEG
ncbi:MAG TPA: hypothetical protein VLT85_12150 [Terriglobales bacterium]|nr:hypothetical protein [Terriglobales bacterium]